jgi:NAD(P)-dependent dehydrogenase (short-subunit alcohol dehydrogenase family)
LVAARLAPTGSDAGAVERSGRVDAQVNNAGVFAAKPFTEYTGEDFTHVLSVNLAHSTRWRSPGSGWVR